MVAAFTSVVCTFGLWFGWDTGGKGFTVLPMGGLEGPMGSHLSQPFFARCCPRSFSLSSSLSSSLPGTAAAPADSGVACAGSGGEGNASKWLGGDNKTPAFPSSCSTQAPRRNMTWCVGKADKMPMESGKEEVASLAGLILSSPLVQEAVVERAAGMSAHEDGEMFVHRF